MPMPQQNPLPGPSELDIVTPVLVTRLETWLAGYYPQTVAFLTEGFKFGFHIPFYGEQSQCLSHNLKSASQHKDILQMKIQNELDSGRVAGPFDAPPLPNMQFSPLGLVPKKDEGQFRLIHHLSFPDGKSINDGIPAAMSSVTYQNIDDAVRLLKRSGPASFMCKTDIENAFRIIPLSPDDYHLVGFQVDGKFFYDKCLAMGLSSSCRLFECFSTSLQWIADTKLKVFGCAHILDDFFFVAPSYSRASTDLNQFLACMADIGVPMKSSKTVLPCTTISFVGIELDSISMEKRLPLDKLEKIRNLLAYYSVRKAITLKELQSITGLLSYACAVVAPGRPFLRRLTDLMIGLRKPHYKRRLNKEARADLQAWRIFIDHFNGKSLFLQDVWLTSDQIHLYTDASNVGFGGFCGRYWFSEQWNGTSSSHHINIKELFPIVLAIELWGASMLNKCILFHCDNLSVVHIINKQTSKDRVLMRLVRRLVVMCLRYNIMFQAEHIAGLENVYADQLSRLQIIEFLRVFPFQDQKRVHIPPDLLLI